MNHLEIAQNPESKAYKGTVDFIAKLKDHNFLFWTKDIIFSRFEEKGRAVVVGALHLSSKP